MAAREELGGDSAAHESAATSHRHGQRVLVRAGAREDRLNGASPMPEDLLQLPANHRRVRQLAQQAERQRVIDDVDDAGPIPLGHEGVAMIPAAVRAFQLDVAEPVGRVIVADPASPAHRDPKERPNSVVDLQAVAHRRVRRLKVEAKAWRGDAAEVLRPREEGEDLVDRTINEQLSAQAVRGHGALRSSGSGCSAAATGPGVCTSSTRGRQRRCHRQPDGRPAAATTGSGSECRRCQPRAAR